ncbi:glycosyltransferase family 2 protein [Aerococcus urinaeequi]|uniref:glycosyltransferase family 2 protein n=1 Tax=Aerococcus urinaeequi TaxID=51665 RepID=UPI003AB08361
MKLAKKVTVLMPVYNAEKYLRQAVESILNQTYKEFDLLVIDDGSTDNSAFIIKEFNDSRIIYLKNERNLGITKTLNRGLELIESEYIVRMDSDDICKPKRLEEQIFYMDKNKNIAISGTNIIVFSEEKNIIDTRVRVSTKPNQVRTELLFHSPLFHPTVIVRNEVIKKENFKYSPKFEATEDYGLWQDVARKYDISNLEKQLLRYRVHSDSIRANAQQNKLRDDKAHIELYKEMFSKLGVTFTEKQLVIYRKFITYNLKFDENEISLLSELLIDIKYKLPVEKYDINYFDKLVSKYYRVNFQLNKKSPKLMMATYYKNFNDTFKFNYLDLVKLSIKYIFAITL